MRPRVVSENIVYANPWITLYEKKIAYGTNGKLLDYYVVGKRLRIAAVLAIDDNDTVLLTRQYRFAVSDSPLDLPGGGVMASEKPVDAARRELKEETGFSCRELTLLTTRYLDSGQKDCIQYIYLARGLAPGRQNLDPGEKITVVTKNLDTLYAEILAGEHRESTLIIALLFYVAGLKKS